MLIDVRPLDMQNLKENLGALNIKLAKEDVEEVHKMAAAADLKGTRYPESRMHLLFAETPELKE